jgi:predicted nucleotide-binding protein
VNDALVVEFEGVESPPDYYERQVSIIRKWVGRTTPQVAPAPVANRNVELLREQIAAANGGTPDSLTEWRQRSATALRIGLGQNHPLIAEFGEVRFTPMVFSPDTLKKETTDARRTGVKQSVAILESAVLEIEMRDVDADQATVNEKVVSTGGVVFIVHGHDTKTLIEVALAVSRLTGDDAVILHDQPNRGQTIVEKFERHASDAGFVVVLATADDLGQARDAKEMQARARQNVVFELGYFIGALGRDKVAVLHDEAVELPSDMDGVLYIPNDVSGGWKLTLAREMRAAGLTVDSNRL